MWSVQYQNMSTRGNPYYHFCLTPSDTLTSTDSIEPVQGNSGSHLEETKEGAAAKGKTQRRRKSIPIHQKTCISNIPSTQMGIESIPWRRSQPKEESPNRPIQLDFHPMTNSLDIEWRSKSDSEFYLPNYHRNRYKRLSTHKVLLPRHPGTRLVDISQVLFLVGYHFSWRSLNYAIECFLSSPQSSFILLLLIFFP